MTGLRAALALASLAAGLPAAAELPGDPWELENGYETQLLYLHALVNYAYDVEWQFEWERRRFADNALRINTGSVSSDELLTDIDLNLNEPLNDKWRFFGQFNRAAFRRRPGRGDQWLLGLERSLDDRNAVYVGVNPEFNKEFIDAEFGYARYSKDREQYLRLGLRAVDLNWTSKNQVGGTQEQSPYKLTWAVRQAIGKDLYLYTEGLFGPGYERLYPDAIESPELAREEQREDEIIVRLTLKQPNQGFWSVLVDWYDFSERKEFRVDGFDYDYENRQLNVGLEHVRLLKERHRLRLLLQYVDQTASSRGFRGHDFERSDVLAGVFYEYLWPNSGLSLAYAAGQPDIAYLADNPDNSFAANDYTDKLILGWRYSFSKDAAIRVSVAQEVSQQGFGGAAVQFQMAF